MELSKSQSNDGGEFCNMNFRIENKKNAVRIRKRVKCESCGKFFLQRNRDIHHCVQCGNGVNFGR